MTPTSPNDPLAYKSHRDVLAMVGLYTYVTSKQATRRLYSPSSPKYANKLLKDLTDTGYLQKVNWIEKGPSAGQPEAVWSLTPKGRKALTELDLPISVRPKSRTDHGQIFMAHSAAVNEVLITAELFARDEPNVELTGFLHEQALKRYQITVPLAGKTATVTPDGWVHYTIDEIDGALLFEVDRGTEDRTKWQQKILAILELLKEPESIYSEYFGEETVQVAVVVRSLPSQRTKAPQERCAELLEWTETTASSAWGPLFSFTPVDPVSVTPREFFTEKHWFNPHATTPRALIPRERLT